MSLLHLDCKDDFIWQHLSTVPHMCRCSPYLLFLFPSLPLFLSPSLPPSFSQTIPIILRKANPEDIKTVLDHIQEENKQLEHSKLRGKVLQAHRRPPSMRRFHTTSDHYPKSIPVQLSRIHFPPQFTGPHLGVSRAGIDEPVVVDVGEEVCVGVANEEGGSDNSTDKVVSSSETEGLESVPPSLSPSSSSLGSSGSSVPQEDTPTLTRKRSLFGLHSPFTSRRSPPPRRQTISKISTRRLSEQVSRPPPTIAKTSLSVTRSTATAASAASSSSAECDSDAVVISLPPIFATRYVHIRQGNSTYIGYVFKVRKAGMCSTDFPFYCLFRIKFFPHLSFQRQCFRWEISRNWGCLATRPT